MYSRLTINSMHLKGLLCQEILMNITLILKLDLLDQRCPADDCKKQLTWLSLLILLFLFLLKSLMRTCSCAAVAMSVID
jgi:hypothetical protein